LRAAIDTGGTFTDLMIQEDDGGVAVHKSPTTPADPIEGILDVLAVAAAMRKSTVSELIGRIEMLVYGTTVALNALLTGTTARTAFLTTRGHPDVLVLREGGREHFNVRAEYPRPFVPRSLTFEIPERIGADGSVVEALDEDATVEVLTSLNRKEIEAVAVCLIWSIVNPAHELRVGELLSEYLPGVPHTLSHQLNPSIREYRRASATAIDASLKPVMSTHLTDAQRRLRDAGFTGRLLMVTSSGGLRDIDEVAQAPIHSIKSGPAMAPVAGRHYAETHAGRGTTAVVVDTGGTSYDVSLVRRGRLPWTRETWIGTRYLGHMTGFPSIDVRSYGAGGGSIAWVDSGGLLHVGPESAGALPGPACYGRGGTRPTVTDAALVLGYIDPEDFLGGAMPLQPSAAVRALKEHVGEPIGLSHVDAAAAIMQLVTEHMARAVEDTAVAQGVDVRTGVIVAGGGASGLNCVAVARRLGCRQLFIPDVAAVLSAAGALRSDLTAHYSEICRTSTSRFSHQNVGETLRRLRARAEAFVQSAGNASSSVLEFSVEGHYPSEVYDLESLIPDPSLDTEEKVEALRQAFHAAHHERFAVIDLEAPVEFVTWHVRVSCPVGSSASMRTHVTPATLSDVRKRRVFFSHEGWLDVPIYGALPARQSTPGPVIVSSSVTTVVVEPGAAVEASDDGTLLIDPGSSGNVFTPGHE
jgi:N-methylhydantoinase A